MKALGHGFWQQKHIIFAFFCPTPRRYRTNIVINQLYQETGELCDFCRARREMQQKNLARIRNIFGEKLGKILIEVPLFKEEIREYHKLKEMGTSLIN